MECLPSEQGERHREVQAEHADDSDEDDRQEQVGAVPHVGQAGPELAWLPTDPIDRSQLPGAQRDQGRDHGEVARDVAGHHRSGADRGDQHPGDSRADDPRAVERDAVEGDPRAHQVGTHQLHHKGLADGCVERRRAT